MILKTIQIEKYKCINDSTPFDVDPDVTCLVGKNEAGKTAILEALHRLKPESPELGRFDYVREYFKPEMLAYEKTREEDPEIPIWTEWQLEELDYLELEQLVGSIAARSIKSVQVYKHWDDGADEFYLEFEMDEGAVVNHLLESSGIRGKEHKDLHSTGTIQELAAALGEPAEDQKKRLALATAIKQRFGDKSPRDVVYEAIRKRVPRFAFFSQYLLMPGQLSVDQFKKSVAEKTLGDADRVFTSLLAMIGMTVDKFAAVDNYEELSARLEAAGSMLTRELRAFWPDGAHLSMDFRFDHGMPKDPPPFNSGWIFRPRIKNERYGASTGFDQRSNGFIWFFSFLVWFTQLKRNYKGDLVLLLDEPGMALHGTAQRELLRFIDQRLASEYQVIYTTHSPFMLDPSHLMRARPVEDVFRKPGEGEDPATNPARGTKVFDDWWRADKLTLFPLRGCLAYDLTQSLFIGDHNILVEGPADLMFIDWFKRKLARLGRPTLSESWTITPCGSITKIGAFLNLFSANHLHCAVLCDYADGGKREVHSLEETAILASAAVLTCDEFAGKPQADIEDIVGDELYAALVNGTYQLSGKNAFIPPASETGQVTGRILKAAEAHMRLMPPEIAEFSHAAPADFLLRQGLDVDLPGTEGALDRFQVLFERLNALLAEHLATKG